HRCRTSSAVPSVEALSTTITAAGPGGGSVSSDSSNSQSIARTFQATVTIQTEPRHPLGPLARGVSVGLSERKVRTSRRPLAIAFMAFMNAGTRIASVSLTCRVAGPYRVTETGGRPCDARWLAAAFV